MCKNCNYDDTLWYFLVFDKINHNELLDFEVCDECLLATIEKLDSNNILYVFDRIKKDKVKKLC